MADDEKQKDEDAKDEKAKEPEVPPPPHFEEEVKESTHSARIAGAEVTYRATAGRMILKEEDGKKKASFFYVAYARDDVDDPSSRPIVFCFNGGPGSSSVWLHLGAFGPRRVQMADDEGMPGPLPGRLVDNDDSLLDVADLVFVDPVGTGFSRAIPGDEAKTFAHFTRDIEAVGEFIRIFITRNERWGSPKFIAGESYGTTRAAGLAGHLYRRNGLALNGLVLVSSILNFQTAGFDRKTWTFEPGNDLPYQVFLPTYAAAAWYHRRLEQRYLDLPLPEFLQEVERFAATDYAVALFAGDGLEQGRFDEIAERLAGYTGLPLEYVRAYRLRIEILRFCKELLRPEGRTIGRIDARYTGIDRFRDGDTMESDPSIDAVMGPYTSALNDYVRRELEYESDLPYEVISETMHSNWDYEDFKNAHVDVSETLRETMSRNPLMRVFVANGYYDLATPHFATEYTFDHLGLDPSLRDNVRMGYYEAGHMMYVHSTSRARLAEELRSFIAR